MLAPKPTGGSPSAAAFERLYRRHVGEVYRYAAAMLPNAADAEDVVQTTFLNAFRAFERGQRPQRPLSWLMTIAHNVCRQRYRQQQRRPSEVVFEDDIAAAEPEEEAVSAEDIRRALSQLGFNQRTALVMRELEGRSYAEIAERLELSHGAVETLIFRARRALREQIEGTLTCGEAGRAISRQLDGVLARRERGALRAHLRSCPRCERLARRMRGQRTAIKALGAFPLPASLASFSGGGLAASTGARVLALKLAGAAAAVVLAAGAGWQTARTVSAPRTAAQATVAAAPGTHVALRMRVAAAPAPRRRAWVAPPRAAVTTTAVGSPAAPASSTPVVAVAPSRRVSGGPRAAHGNGAAARRPDHGRPVDPGKSGHSHGHASSPPRAPGKDDNNGAGAPHGSGPPPSPPPAAAVTTVISDVAATVASVLPSPPGPHRG